MPLDPYDYAGWAELAARIDPDQLPTRHAPTPYDARGPGWQDRALAEVWARFVALRIPYQAPAWVPTKGQRIRDPHLIAREGGTCLDLVSFVAALCLQADLRPFLVIDPAFTAASGHAILGIDVGAAASPVEETPTRGVSTTYREAVINALGRRLMLLDPTFGAAPVDASRTEDRGLDDLEEVSERTTRGLEASSCRVQWWGEGALQLVDVAVAQATVARLELDLSLRPEITSQLPRAGDWTPYPSREKTLDGVVATIALRWRSPSWILLSGHAGSGKSRLAYEAADRASGGAAWFLHGSSKSTFRLSLATAMAREASRPFGEDRLGREEDADEARARLVVSRQPWVVVIDNANLDPAELGPLPTPGPGQVVIVTTQPKYLASWARRFPEAATFTIGPLDDEDLALHHRDVDTRMLPPPARTPLLLRALAASGASARPSTFGEEPALDVVRATHSALAKGVAAAAEAIAWLPPEGLPASLIPGGVAVGEVLATAALLTPSLARSGSEPTYDLHRSFGAALRKICQNGSGIEHALSPAGERHLDRFGDSDTLDRLADDLVALPPGTRGRGSKLVAVARLLELHGRIVRKATPTPQKPTATPQHSAEGCAVFAETEPEVLGDALLGAACHQAIARAVNQDPSRNRPSDPTDSGEDRRRQESVTDAIRRCDDALAVIPRGLQWFAVSSLRALLLQKSAAFVAQEERLGVLNEVEGILTEAREGRECIIEAERKQLYPEEPHRWLLDPLVARGRYNMAGLWNDYACATPVGQQEERRNHLDRMLDVYESVLDLRLSIYGDHRPHPHIAICRWGMGLALYQRTWLLDDPRRGEEREAGRVAFDPAGSRTKVLREAADQVYLALRDQQLMGDDGDTDVEKSLNLLGKVTVARLSLLNPQKGVHAISKKDAHEVAEMLEWVP